MVISGCKNRDLLTIDGTVKEKKQDYIHLSRLEVNLSVPLDSAKIKNNGKFKFKMHAKEPDFYQISYTPDNFMTLLAEPGERIKLTFNQSNLYTDYSVSGSPGSEQIQLLDLKLFSTKNKLDSLNSLYIQSSKEPEFDKNGPLIEKEYINLINEQRKFNIEFILKNISSLSAIKALYQKLDDETYVLNRMRDLQFMKIVSDSLKVHYPNSKHTKALITDFTNEMNQVYSRQIMDMASNLPETILDPDLVDVNGKRVALSSLRGKYVLLTFWSADSRECVAENIQLKTYYSLYKNKGFQIYQINLDTDENKWKTAVKFDELPWISTREDDPSNPENARLYNVRSIPANFLYDPQGNVIASNLHGRNLQIKLEQLFK